MEVYCKYKNDPNTRDKSFTTYTTYLAENEGLEGLEEEDNAVQY
jgi:hypothetical protein